MHNVYEMDLFSREKFKAKLYQILINDVLNKFQQPIVPHHPKGNEMLQEMLQAALDLIDQS